MDQTFLIEFGLVLIVAAGLGVLARFFRQPLILAYLVAGILIGPFAFGLIKDIKIIENLGSIGIVFLLFLIGLELNPRKLIELGGSAITIAGAQIIFSGLIYFLVARAFGIQGMGAIYLAAALTFSSTAIIVTLLSNRNDLDSLHGKILIGVLLIQDFVAILLLTFFSGISSRPEISNYIYIFQIIGRAAILFAIAYLVSRFILPLTMHRIAKSQELLFLSSLAWCFMLAIVALVLGFSAEIGAFLAGISLAPLPYSPHIAAKTKPLRDFFIMLFFIYLGTSLIFSKINLIIAPALVFSLLILIINPLIVMVVMSLLGYKKRTSFISGMHLTQVSEFSFIVVALGSKVGLFSDEMNTMTSIIAIITVFISTYIISNIHKIYHVARPLLSKIHVPERKEELINLPEKLKKHIVLIGCHRMGSIVLETLKKKKEKVLIVDFDPHVIEELILHKENCIFGDAIDHEIIEHLNLSEAKLVISTLNKFEENQIIIETYRKINHDLPIILTSDNTEDAVDLYEMGADLVIIPTFISGDYISYILKEIYKGKIEKSKFERLKNRELKAIQEHNGVELVKKIAEKSTH